MYIFPAFMVSHIHIIFIFEIYRSSQINVNIKPEMHTHKHVCTYICETIDTIL